MRVRPFLPIHPPRSVAIVGNAPDQQHPVDRIDHSDWVVRFNNAPGYGSWSGRRCTHLALLNHGGQMREWLADPAFVARPAVRAADVFLFPFPPKPGPADAYGEDGRDWTEEALAMLAPLGRMVEKIPDGVVEDAQRILGVGDRRKPSPSTGFLVVLHLLAKLPPGVRIEAFGFGFAGWPGHSWEGERRWFERMAAEGRLRLHPVE